MNAKALVAKANALVPVVVELRTAYDHWYEKEKNEIASPTIRASYARWMHAKRDLDAARKAAIDALTAEGGLDLREV